MEFRAGKYMVADKGEKAEASAAARMISRLWLLVKMEYCRVVAVHSRGVDSESVWGLSSPHEDRRSSRSLISPRKRN
jgi:hypothetical protein